MSDRTTIVIPKNLKYLLEELKTVPQEPYWSVIQRLYDNFQKPKKKKIEVVDPEKVIIKKEEITFKDVLEYDEEFEDNDL